MSAIQPLEVDDTRLAHAVAAGDAAAFDELYRLYAGRLAAYGGRVAGDPAAGEDVAQVALLNAYEALRRGTRPRHFRAWLYRIAHNAALEARRRRPACAELDEEREPAWADESSELRATLLEALGDLPERQRAAYLLREVQGLRIAEIAAALELTTEQVEQALFAARNRLAEQLTFGRRIDCDAVHELADAPDLAARRALKSHVRSCPSCRSAGHGRRAGLGALGPLSALRDALAWLLGGGGAVPAAAKLGAVAATVAVAAAGAPAVVPHGGGDTSQPQRAPAALVADLRPLSPPVPQRRPAAHVAPRRTPASAPPIRSPLPFREARRAAAFPVPPAPAPVPAATPAPAEAEDDAGAAPEPTVPPPALDEPPAEEPAPLESEEPAPAPEPEPLAEEPAPDPVEEARPELEREPEREPAVVASELESTPAPAPDADLEPAPVNAEAAVPRSSELPAADQDSEPAPALSR